MKISSGLVVVLTAVLLLTACGEEPPAESSLAPPQTAKPAAKAPGAASDVTAGMVSAVRTGAEGGSAIVAVKFDLKSRPEAGMPVKIALAFVPQIRADALSATFVAGTGVKISSAPPAEFTKIEVGSAYPYELTVTPETDGIHTVSTIVQLHVPGDSKVQTFAIPVIVGAPR